MPRSFVSTILAANSALLVDGDLSAIGDYFTADFVSHLTGRDLSGGHAGVRRFVGTLRRAFPRLEVEVELLVQGASRVAWQRTLRGRHEGDYMGFAATGRRIVWPDMMTSRFRDGLIAEDWAISDLALQLLRARPQ